MAYVNLPISLSGMFDDLDERLARVETGYSGPQASADAAQATAVSAQSLAVSAQTTAVAAQISAALASAQAISAQSSALIAQAQAVAAQNVGLYAQATAVSAQATAAAASAQATIASSQAVAAQTSANGKNTVLYGTAAPSGTSHTTGDIYFQFNGSNNIIAQYTWNGSSWVSNAITSTVIANLDAGKITSGTITSITYDNGSGTFHVSPSGALSASSATITGVINATSGYIGTTSTGWNISAAGIASQGGGGYISGGTIQGTSFINGGGTFYVNSSGALVASSATITGTVNATTGYFGSSSNGWLINSTGITGVGSGYIAGGFIQGTVFTNGLTFSVSSSGYLTASSGQVGGWYLSSTRLYATGSTYMDSSTGDIATIGNITSGGNISTSSGNISSGGLLSGNTVQVNSGGSLYSLGSNRFNGVMYYGDGIIFSHPTTGASANVYVNPTAGSNYGTFARSTSSQRYKVEIQEQSIPLDSILALTPKSYIDKAQAEEKGSTEGLQRYLGLIAEDVTLIPVLGSMLANLDSEGNPDSVNYDRIAVALIPLLKDHEARLNKLEGK